MQRDDLKRETSINEREPDLKHQGYKVRASHIRDADEALQNLHICAQSRVGGEGFDFHRVYLHNKSLISIRCAHVSVKEGE